MTAAVSLTTKRERKHRRSMERPKPAGAFNPHSYDHRAELAYACALKAVQSGFSYLSIDQISNPPRTDKVAQLARQIAIHIMVHGLGIEQRQVCRIQGRQRTSIHFALQTVEMRRECPVFAAAHDRMMDAAVARYEAELERAA